MANIIVYNESSGITLNQGDNAFSSLFTNCQTQITFACNLNAYMNGTCEGNLSEKVLIDGVDKNEYTISFMNSVKKTHIFEINCSELKVEIEFKVENGKLIYLLNKSFEGKSYIAYGVTGSIIVKKIEQIATEYSLSYNPTPVGVSSFLIERTATKAQGVPTGNIVSNPASAGSVKIYHGDTISITATATSGYESPSYYLNSSGQTVINSISGNVQAALSAGAAFSRSLSIIQITGATIKVQKIIDTTYQPTDCDGCYCYCSNDERIIDDGHTLCGSITYTDLADGSVVTPGELLGVSVVVNSGYAFSNLIVNGTSYTNSYTQIAVSAGTGPIIITAAVIQTNTWKTIYNSTFTMNNSSTSKVTKTLSGLAAGRPTRVTISAGSYSSQKYFPATNGSYPSYDCDGGCYCYCDGGVQVADGERCYYSNPARTETYMRNITTGLQSNNNGSTITLSLGSGNGSIMNGTLSVSGTDTLSFDGYNSMGDQGFSKTITITKVEQNY